MNVWDAAIATLQKVEGGYIDHPSDPGGETNWGISKRAYPNVDVKSLTKAEAAEIAKRDYWNKIPNSLPDDLRWMVFDSAFHHGLSRALEWLSDSETLDGYTAKRIRFMTNLETFNTFGRGWMRRIATVLHDIAVWRGDGLYGEVNTLVLHDFPEFDNNTYEAKALRGNFLYRVRNSKLDVRWSGRK